MAEGFYHQRITSQAKAYLPVMGAVLTILVIVIGGGLLVRGQSSEQPSDVVQPHSVTQGGESDKNIVSKPLTASHDDSEAKSSPEPSVRTKGVKPSPKSQPVHEVARVKQRTTGTDAPSKGKLSPVDAPMAALEKAIKSKSIPEAQAHLTRIDGLLKNAPSNPVRDTKLKSMRTSLAQLKAGRDKQIKRTLVKARKQLQSADFNQVEASLKRLKTVGAQESMYRDIELKLRKARKALTQARQYYAKADCRRTLTSLEPIIDVTPRSKRVAKLINACRQALPPQRL